MFNALELKVPPLALVFLLGALIWVVSAYSLFTITLPWRSALALIFYTVGSAIVLASVLTFRRMKTIVNPFDVHLLTVFSAARHSLWRVLSPSIRLRPPCRQ